MKIKMPDYQQSILNVTSSILKHYQYYPQYDTLKELDEILNRNYQHLSLIILDGMGVNILKKYLYKKDALRRYLKKEITSVFPPTTVAATTAVLSGKPPFSSGFVGWVQYFKEEDSNTIVFYNEDYYEPQRILKKNLQEVLRYETIFEKIEKSSADVKTYEIFPPFREDGFPTFSDQVDKLIEISKTNNRTFSYTYWGQPDTAEHYNGISGKETRSVLKNLNKEFERLIENLGKDNVVIVIADHGLTDVKEINIFKHRDLTDCFLRNPSIEPRACNFFIKEEKQVEFPRLFKKYYGNKFQLIPKKELYESNLMGYGEKHIMLDNFIGDFLAVGIKKFSFSMSSEKFFKAHHAGLTEPEMIVPLIIYEKK